MSEDWLDNLEEFDCTMPECRYCGQFADDLEVDAIGWTSADLVAPLTDHNDIIDSWFGLACTQQECLDRLADTAADLAEMGWVAPEPDPDRERIIRAVQDAIASDPLLARRLQPQQRPAGPSKLRWVVTVDDRVRDRLRYLLRHHEIDWRWRVTVPYLRGSGRRIISVPSPHVVAPTRGVD